MSIITKQDIVRLVEDKNLVDDIIKEVLASQDMLQSLAEEAAESIAEVLDKDEKFRERMLKAANQDPIFKKQLLDKIINELN